MLFRVAYIAMSKEINSQRQICMSKVFGNNHLVQELFCGIYILPLKKNSRRTSSLCKQMMP